MCLNTSMISQVVFRETGRYHNTFKLSTIGLYYFVFIFNRSFAHFWLYSIIIHFPVFVGVTALGKWANASLSFIIFPILCTKFICCSNFWFFTSFKYLQILRNCTWYSLSFLLILNGKATILLSAREITPLSKT